MAGEAKGFGEGKAWERVEGRSIYIGGVDLEEGAKDFTNPAISGDGRRGCARERNPVREEGDDLALPSRIWPKTKKYLSFLKRFHEKIILENKMKTKYRSIIYQNDHKIKHNLMG